MLGRIKTVTLSPLPVQNPHPPVWVAAFGPKARTQPGHLGLPYIASLVESLNTLKNNLSCYWKAFIDAQHSSHRVIPIMGPTFISDNRARVREVKAAPVETARQVAKARAREHLANRPGTGRGLGPRRRIQSDRGKNR